MKTGEEYSVKIEKMLYGGMGLGKINSIPIFVQNSAPEDILKIKIVKMHKNYLEAEIVEIETPSKYRKNSECSFSKICGSCDFLHIVYEEQLRQKKQIIEENFKKIAGIEVKVDGVIPSPKIFEYRCKVQLPYSETKVSKRLLSGYYKKNSHELINIKYCPMHTGIINDINEYIKEEGHNLGISGYNELKNTGLIRHVIYRISSDLSQILVMFVINSNIIGKELNLLSEALIKKFHNIVGICANFNTKKTNVIQGDKTQIIKGQDYYIEVIGNKKYRVSSGSFFQVNPYSAEKIFERVKEIISQRIEKPLILDAYSGVSAFGIWLSDIAGSITSIEESKSSVNDAIENIKLNCLDNIKVINGDAGKEFEKLVQKGVKFDVSITDPPRKGCTLNSLEYLAKLTGKYIVYVSCNPSTLARDVKILKEKGFKLVYLQGADMFPNTYHIETIALLERNL